MYLIDLRWYGFGGFRNLSGWVRSKEGIVKGINSEIRD